MCSCSAVVHGAIGIVKAATGFDRAPEAVIERRRAICRECPNAKPCPITAGKACQCSLCGCLLKAKTANAGEKCRAGKW